MKSQILTDVDSDAELAQDVKDFMEGSIKQKRRPAKVSRESKAGLKKTKITLRFLSQAKLQKIIILVLKTGMKNKLHQLNLAGYWHKQQKM